MFGLLQIRKLQHLIHESGHAPGLFLDIVQPFVLTDGLFQHGNICVDDRQGRFQLVAGVRDKSFLHLCILFHRSDNDPGEEPGQHGEQTQGHGKGRERKQQGLHDLIP